MQNSNPCSSRAFQGLVLGSAVLLATMSIAVSAPPASPAPDSRAAKALAALIEASNKENTLSNSEKFRGVREGAESIDEVLPLITDPDQFRRLADTIMEYGAKQDVNFMECWGEDPVTQAHLKPLSSAAIKLYDAALISARRRVREAAALDQSREENSTQLHGLQNLVRMDVFARNVSVYEDCIATSSNLYVDPNTKLVLTAEDVRQRTMRHEPMTSLRKSMVQEALSHLKDQEDPQKQATGYLRNRVGKLYLAAGEYDQAVERFRSVYSADSDGLPLPTPFDQYEARYFCIVAELLAGDKLAATSDKAALDDWQKTTLPDSLRALTDNEGHPVFDDMAIVKAAGALAARSEMLQWRFRVLAGELSPDVAAKKTAAENMRQELKEANPEKATAQGWAIGPRAPARPLPDLARRIVFVCDASPSMAKKLPILKDQLGNAIINLRPVQSFEIIVFQDGKQEAKYDSFSRSYKKEGIVPATPEAKRAGAEFLNAITTARRTDPIPGIIAAFKAEPDLIYLLTDGDFPDNDAFLKTIRDLNKAHNVKINTIAFVDDGDKDTAFLTLLETIAKESGGKFKHLKASDL